MCLLAVENEGSLNRLIEQAEKKGIKYVAFHEPDFGEDILTSVTFEPTDAARRLCSSIPLMLREKNPIPV